MTIGRVFAVLFVLGLIGLALINPSTAGLPPCPVHAGLRVYCPGCGSLRSLHSLFRGDIAQAWHYNPLPLCVLPIVLVGLFSDLLGYKSRITEIRPIFIRMLLASIILYGVVRNLPQFNYLTPQRINYLPPPSPDFSPEAGSEFADP